MPAVSDNSKLELLLGGVLPIQNVDIFDLYIYTICNIYIKHIKNQIFFSKKTSNDQFLNAFTLQNLL